MVAKLVSIEQIEIAPPVKWREVFLVVRGSRVWRFKIRVDGIWYADGKDYRRGDIEIIRSMAMGLLWEIERGYMLPSCQPDGDIEAQLEANAQGARSRGHGR